MVEPTAVNGRRMVGTLLGSGQEAPTTNLMARVPEPTLTQVGLAGVPPGPEGVAWLIRSSR